MVVTSSDFSTLSALSFNSSVSILSLFIIELIICCLISSLLNLLILLGFSELFLNINKKNNHYTANLKHPIHTKNAMCNLILRLY